MSANFEELISKVKEYGKKKVSVAVAEDAPILEAVEEARKQGFADVYKRQSPGRAASRC